LEETPMITDTSLRSASLTTIPFLKYTSIFLVLYFYFFF
jgi:hypothetical protein